MSSSDRRTLLGLLALASLAACGFTPAYGPGGAAEGLQGRIRFDDPSDRDSFNFVTRLHDRLGRPQAPAFLLSYAITTRQVGLGIEPDNTTSRYDLIGQVTWTISDSATGAELASGKAESFAGRFDTGSTVTSLAGQEDQALRLMVMLADKVVTQILATAEDWS
jgi:LPS-assembly lipoprotein